MADESLLTPLVPIVTLGLLSLACFGAGQVVLSILRLVPEDGLERWVWPLGLGVVCWGLLLTGLGAAGMWYSLVLAALTLAGCALGAAILARQALARLPALPLSPLSAQEAARDRRNGLPRWLAVSCAALGVSAAAGSLAGALAPPTAGDALCYHLEIPKEFLRAHGFVELPYHDHSTFPMMVEMLFLWAMALEGPISAQLVHWGLGLLAAMGTVVMARPILGRTWSWPAGTLVLLIPAVTNEMTAPLNDVGLIPFTTLGLAAWLNGRSDDGNLRWNVVSGLLLGGALGTKYTALLFCTAMAALGIVRIIKDRGQRLALVKSAVVVGSVAVAASGIWYARAAVLRGNPVYPFLSEWVGQAGPTPSGDKTPLGVNLPDLVASPWHLTMHPERFGSRAFQWGPIFLAVLPGLLLVRKLRGLSDLAWVGGVYFLLWFLMRQNLRFLLPAAPLACIAAGWVIAEWSRFPAIPRAAGGVLVAGMASLGALASVARSTDQWAVAAGWESRQDYLTRQEPTWLASWVANTVGREGARILSQDYRSYYFEGQAIRESVFRRLTGYPSRVEAEGLASVLAREGFTHVLLAESSGPGIGFEPTLTRLVEADMAGTPQAGGEERRWTVLCEYTFADSDGSLRRYRLVAIPPIEPQVEAALAPFAPAAEGPKGGWH
jgi:4-amino-4-deoxy-L-arabinose transferase-like glycosyltransferase